MKTLGRTLAVAAGVLVLGGPATAAGEGRHFSGVAAYYDTHYHGRTASGVQYNAASFTAAHRSLAFGTRLKVTDRRTRRSVEVVVNDRGPFTRGRVLDLSLAAARHLQMTKRGLARVDAEVLR